MSDKQQLYKLYSNKMGKSNFFSRLDFNRSISEFRVLNERFAEVMGEKNSEEALYQMYLDLRQSIGGKEAKKIISNPDIGDASTLVETIREKYGKDMESGGQNSETLNEIIAYSKLGLEYPLDIQDVGINNNLMLYINFDIVRNQSKDDIETIYAQYGEQLYNAYVDSSISESLFEDAEEFQEAIADSGNAKHSIARLICATQLTSLSEVYSLDEMLSDEERVKKEMQIGLTKRIFLEKRRAGFAKTDYIKKRALYAELAETWDESDLDSYESVKQYANYLLEMLQSKDIPEEKRAELQELYTKLNAISNLTIEEIVQRKEQVRDVMADSVLQYEVLIRENLVDNIREVQPQEIQEHKIQYVSGDKSEEFGFTGTMITCEAQLGTMLVHFFSKKDFSQRKELYGESIRLDLMKRRGLQDIDEITADDPEFVSAMQYYDDVIADNTVVRGFDQIFRHRDDEGNLTEKKQNDSEHICAQTVSIARVKGLQIGAYGLVFDRNGIEPEAILMSSTTNIGSNKGIYSSTRTDSQYGAIPVRKTSAPIEALRDAERPKLNNEVDLERNLVKPSAICYFGRNPLKLGERTAFLEVTQIAQKSGLPVLFVDMEAIEREQQAKHEMETKKENER